MPDLAVKHGCKNQTELTQLAVKKQRKSAKSALGFSLLELLVVISLLAILAGVALSAYDSVGEDAAQQLTQSEMIEVSKAIKKLKSDTGRMPQTLHPADFNDLFEMADASHTAFAEWDKDTGRGWRGPYLSRQGVGWVTVCNSLLADGSGNVTNCATTDQEKWQGLADSFQHKPDDNATENDKTDDTLVWRACTDTTNSACDYREKWGRPYLIFDMDNDDARIVSMGADGRYDGINTTDICLPNGDDLVLCLKR